MADIVEQLLLAVDTAWGETNPLHEKAAAEILKLRAEIARLKELRSRDCCKVGDTMSKDFTPSKDNYA